MATAFVDFLQTTGRISPNMAQDACGWLSGSRTPVGLIAVNHGLITGEQIDEILERQKQTDLRFGEIAVELGYLSNEQVDVLLEIQKLRESMTLAEGLALAGVLELDEALRGLGEFLRATPTAVAQADADRH